jgi:membrane protein YqaA with SNARE-associated domain
VVDLVGKTGVVTMVAYLVVILGGKLHVATVLTMFVGGSAAAAFADVTIDAMVAIKSRQKPELATHIQSLCSVCSSLGGLTGYLLSGLAVHLLGSQVLFNTFLPDFTFTYLSRLLGACIGDRIRKWNLILVLAWITGGIGDNAFTRSPSRCSWVCDI